MEASFQTLVEGAQDLIALLDVEGRTRYISPSAKRLLGREPEALTGRTLFEHIHPDDQPAVREALERVVQSAGQAETKEARVRHANGEWRTFEFIGRSVQEETTRETVVVVSARDITERKQAEWALHRSQERNEALLHAVPDGLVRVERDGVYRDVRAPQGFDWFMDPDALIGSHTRDVLPPELADRLMRVNQCALETGQMQTLEYDMEVDGEVRYREACIVPYGEDEVVSILRDVTKRKRSENKLRRSRKQLRKLTLRLRSVREEERARIAREVHDVLGQQLTALRLDLVRLERHAKDSADEALADMKVRLSDTIETVRRISSELRPGVLDDLGLSAALEWKARDFEQRTGLTCTFVDETDEPPLTDDHATELFRIFQEILTNVSRHADASRVETHLIFANGVLQLSVHDDGRGITPEDVEDPNALGILGMRERVAPWNGEVDLSGHPNQGTRVTVKLPLDS